MQGIINLCISVQYAEIYADYEGGRPIMKAPISIRPLLNLLNIGSNMFHDQSNRNASSVIF